MPRQSLPGTPLIGRDDDLAQLLELVGVQRPALARRAVLLAGDAGVGKTRLLAELVQIATRAGWRSLTGHCLDLGAGALPYLAFTEAFGRLSLEEPGAAQALVTAHPPLARLIPGRPPAASDRQTEGQPAGEDRSRLFEAVHAALAQHARRQPVLLLIEDLHWADDSTRDLLSFLFNRGTEQVVVVASYRADDLHRRHPLRAAVAGWSRMPSVARQVLRPLPDNHARALVNALHPGTLPEAQLRGILDRAEGNAFFLEELVAAIGLTGRALPTDLVDLLLVRLDQLDEEARQVVRAASVAGRQVGHDLLASVVTLEPPTLDRALRSAVDGNILVPVDSGGYAFRHALLAEAVYDDLLPGELARLHAAFARTMVATPAVGSAAELARHALAAHDLPTATKASIEAGDQAMAVAAPAEAARHYESALRLLPGLDQTTLDVDRVTLVTRASDALAAAGDMFRAVSLVQDALAQLPSDARPEQRAQLLLALVRAAVSDEAGVNAFAATTEALSLVPAEPPSPLRARIVDMHARAAADLRRDDEAADWARQAWTLGRDLGLADVRADAATTLAHLDERAGDPESARRQLEQTIAAARAANQATVELRSLYHLGELHYELGRVREAHTTYTQARIRAVDTGRPWSPYGLESRAMSGVTAYVLGDWPGALAAVDVRGESPPPLAEALLTAVAMGVAAGRGETGALAQLPGLRARWDGEGMIAIHAGAAMIDLYGDRGQLDDARRIHDEVVDHLGRLWQQPWFQARIRLTTLLLGQIAAEAARSGTADHPELAGLADELSVAVARTAEQGNRSGRRRGPEGMAWLARAEAEHVRVRWLTGVDPPSGEQLVDAWERAVRGFADFPHRFERARSQARLAAARQAARRTEEATGPAESARRTAADLGAGPLLREVQALRAAGAADPARRSRPEGPGPLTAREQQVLSLVAIGRSNRDIARQLSISPKTASVHVSNILARLGAASRTEAVAVARRRGLLADDTAVLERPSPP